MIFFLLERFGGGAEIILNIISLCIDLILLRLSSY